MFFSEERKSDAWRGGKIPANDHPVACPSISRAARFAHGEKAMTSPNINEKTSTFQVSPLLLVFINWPKPISLKAKPDRDYQ
ncbi:MAG: hypothetical protein R3F36_03115 [Candidatus Competibacteraceae bacterium]